MFRIPYVVSSSDILYLIVEQKTKLKDGAITHLLVERLLHSRIMHNKMDSNYVPNFKVTIKPCLNFFSKFGIKMFEPNRAKTLTRTYKCSYFIVFPIRKHG